MGDRIFATLWKEDGVLILRPEQQAELLKAHPETFSPASGAWGRKGSTTVHLEKANEASVLGGLRTAWSNKSK